MICVALLQPPSSNLQYDSSLIYFQHISNQSNAFLFVPDVPQVSPISTKVMISGEE
jgi:hypothetical protein